jgi:putative ABC transport system substrate-binding protein
LLISYGPTLLCCFAAPPYLSTKSSRGATLAELPIRQPTAFEFVVNLKTAKALGLTIAPRVLAVADEVIE